MMSINFTINEKPYKVNLTDFPIDVTLNTFIRENAQVHGTKFMCLEGGCGVCICAIKGRHPVSKEIKTWATNSCLTLLNSCDGWDIVTIEGIGNRKKGYHPIQKRLAHENGTQCGYCSPGMVMNMYSLLEMKGGKLTMEDVENSFGGNICRCTGYRSILDAMKSFAADSDYEYLESCGKDIEDLGKICPKSGELCSKTCKIKQNFSVKYENGEEWYTARSMDEIFSAFKNLGEKKYRIVAGNTGHGVYRKPNDIQVFIDVNQVPELHTYAIGKQLELGGNMSLTETMELLINAAKTPGYEYCERIVKHIDLVANVPVRNMGTLAGNLSLKHDNSEFPSDIFISLEAVDAKITVMEMNGKTEILSPVEYLKTDMMKKIITKILLDPKPKEEYLYNSYKITPRAQNAHAYVNAGFLLQLREGKVISARICFGGINPQFYHATTTESFLIGKDIFENTTLTQALAKLKEELKPDWVLPDASPEYRTNLACGLFYKYILGFAPESKVKKEYRTGGELLKRPLSSGTQVFDTHKENYPVTEPIMKIEALVQCSGEAFYMNDQPNLPEQLWVAFVHTTEANCQIAQIDPSEAVKVPGVVAFFSAKDIPGKNSFTDTAFFLFHDDEPLFADKKSLYFGQPVGIIVAESQEIAKKAAQKVLIMYEHSTEKILPTIQDVLENNAQHRIFDAFTSPAGQSPMASRATKKVSGNFDMGSQYHFTMEPQTTVCIPKEDCLEVYSSSQFMDITQTIISYILNVPKNYVFLQVRRLGGGFGGKISRNNQVAGACALASYLLNRPVRFVQSIESMMLANGKRFACHSDYEVDTDDNGKILKLVNKFWEDCGFSVNESPIEIQTVTAHKNCYMVDNNWKLQAKGVLTDAPSHTWCRAPGSLEGIAMIENIMEHIARETGKDPVDVRMANIANDNKMKSLLPEFVKDVGYRERKQEIEKFNKENRWRKRGIGLSVMDFPIGYFGSIPATVSIYRADGTVMIGHGGIEMGQGLNTKVVQVASFILGVPIEKIKVRPTDSFTGANAIASGGSYTSECTASAVKKSCEVLLERIKPIRTQMKNATWEQVINQCFLVGMNLVATEAFHPGDLQGYIVAALCCTEVEVDTLTGNILINRVDILEDVGESLSPKIDIGQIEGAFIMGIGYWLSEKLVFNRQNGELLTTRTWNYKPPGAKDIPIDFRIKMLKNSKNPAGFLRSKATGEPAICLAITVIFALRHALESSRNDAGINGKWFHLGAPSTVEDIGLAAGNSVEQFVLS